MTGKDKERVTRLQLGPRFPRSPSAQRVFTGVPQFRLKQDTRNPGQKGHPTRDNNR